MAYSYDRRVAKKLKHKDEWVKAVLKQGPFGGFDARGDAEKLVEAAKERGLHVTSVTPAMEVRKALEKYFQGAKTAAAANKTFDRYISLAADDVKALRKPDVYRVLSEAKSAKELKALSAYIIEGNPDLRSTVSEDAKDVSEEKGW